MSDFDAVPRTALDGARSGRFGNPDENPGLVIAQRHNLGIVALTVRQGRFTELANTVHLHYGLECPRAPRLVQGEAISLIGSGDDHWIAVSERFKHNELHAELATRLDGMASVTDQSDGRVILRLSGRRVRDVIAKIFSIDLHPRSFGPGSAASTGAGHITAQLWQSDDAPTYEIMVFRSFAVSCLRWIKDSAACFGCEVQL